MDNRQYPSWKSGNSGNGTRSKTGPALSIVSGPEQTRFAGMDPVTGKLLLAVAQGGGKELRAPPEAPGPPANLWAVEQ
jgi:hypothetical protein